MDTPQAGEWYVLHKNVYRTNNRYAYILSVDSSKNRLRYTLLSEIGLVYLENCTYPLEKFIVGTKGMDFHKTETLPFPTPKGLLSPHQSPPSQHSLLHAPIDEEAENLKDDELMRRMLFE